MKISAKLTVDAAGTAEQGPSDITGNAFVIVATSGNTGSVYIGNDGNDDVDSSTGYELSPGDKIIIEVPHPYRTLEFLYFDAATSGNSVSILRLN